MRQYYQLTKPAKIIEVSSLATTDFLNLVDYTDAREIALLTNLIVTATTMIEKELRRAFVVRNFKLTLDRGDNFYTIVLVGCNIVITSIKLFSDKGVEENVTSLYDIADGHYPKIYLNENETLPTVELRKFNCFEILYTSGVTPTNIDQLLKDAVAVQVAYLYDNRESGLITPIALSMINGYQRILV